MNTSHRHHPVRIAADAPGWSLIRLSAGGRAGLALVVIALLWLATLAVIA